MIRIVGNRIIQSGLLSSVDLKAGSDILLSSAMPEFEGECDCRRDDGQHVIDLHGAMVRGGLSIPLRNMIVRNGTFVGHPSRTTAVRFWSLKGWKYWFGQGVREFRSALARRVAP